MGGRQITRTSRIEYDRGNTLTARGREHGTTWLESGSRFTLSSYVSDYSPTLIQTPEPTVVKAKLGEVE